jgi:hypothetical protein
MEGRGGGEAQGVADTKNTICHYEMWLDHYPQVVGPASQLLKPLMNVVRVEGVITQAQEQRTGILPDYVIWNGV